MNALKRIRIRFFAVKMYGIICRSDTSKKQDICSKNSTLKVSGRTALIGERSLALRLNGLLLNDNPGGSNMNQSENLWGLKSKDSRSMIIIAGLVISKLKT
jgi:hypothetical protein